MHHDPKHWKDPENFDPTRFLSEDQNTIKYDEWLQPFGYGKYNSLEYTIISIFQRIIFTISKWL